MASATTPAEYQAHWQSGADFGQARSGSLMRIEYGAKSGYGPVHARTVPRYPLAGNALGGHPREVRRDLPGVADSKGVGLGGKGMGRGRARLSSSVEIVGCRCP